MIAVVIFLALRFGLHWKTMNSTIIALAVCACVVAYEYVHGYRLEAAGRI